MKKYFLFWIFVLTLLHAVLPINIQSNGNRIFYHDLKQALEERDFMVVYWAPYVLKVNIGSITDKKKQRVKVNYTLFTNKTEKSLLANGDLTAYYDLERREIKRYIQRDIAKKIAKSVSAHRAHMKKHQKMKSGDIVIEAGRVCRLGSSEPLFRVVRAYGKEDMFFLVPIHAYFMIIDGIKYENILQYMVAENRFSLKDRAIFEGTVLVFKTRSDEMGKMKIIKIRRDRVYLKWEQL